MEFKGTKGKWYKGVAADVKHAGTKKVIADCFFFRDDITEQANAQLIAYAPEMLEMLQSCVNLLERMSPEENSKCDFKIQEIKHLIKKATTI